MSVPPELAWADDPLIRRAAEHANGFVPRRGVDYGWVVEYARQQHDDALTALRRLDDKAASLAGYVAGGAGLLTLGSLSALSNPATPPAAVLAAIPSVALAALALRSALAARKAVGVYSPPSVADAAAWAEHYAGHDGAAAAAFAGHRYLCAVMLKPAIDAKAAAVNASIRWLIWSVGSLALPIVVAAAARLL